MAKLHISRVARYFSMRGLAYSYSINTGIFATESWDDVEGAMYDYLSKFLKCTTLDSTFNCEACHELFLNTKHRVGDLCKECVMADPDPVIDELFFYIEAPPIYVHPAPVWFVPYLEGWEKYNAKEYMSGLYKGMNDSVGKVISNLPAQYKRWKGILALTESSPFMVKFDLYLKEK